MGERKNEYRWNKEKRKNIMETVYKSREWNTCNFVKKGVRRGL